ncbi:hypothetical protein BpHYR1_047039 [Brachionus plicatilis]|uniref:Uncharacterized protein n=1 Tax=Brachionus plicatilis TaxID=10195 RepID=A0A3M7SQB5_BRAPC|nr:hypothetical protein BpHYR1_047039 [Brachionus plicatilis]
MINLNLSKFFKLNGAKTHIYLFVISALFWLRFPALFQLMQIHEVSRMEPTMPWDLYSLLIII